MKINLDKDTIAWQEKGRHFVDTELIPMEIEAEMNQGKLPVEVSRRHKKIAIELGFSRMDVPLNHGGLALRNVEQVAVWEQLGRVTNALCWCFSEPHQWMFDACNDDQLRRYVLPLKDGSRKECYAITERESGSDVVIETAAAHDRGDDVKSLHARCSVAKLYASEAAGRIADRPFKSSVGVVLCVRIVLSDSRASCVWTVFGKVPARFSDWSLQTR